MPLAPSHALQLQVSIPPEKIAAQFIEDGSWMGTLAHIQALALPPEPAPRTLPPPPPKKRKAVAL